LRNFANPAGGTHSVESVVFYILLLLILAALLLQACQRGACLLGGNLV
jgi:hypothetical protein